MSFPQITPKYDVQVLQASQIYTFTRNKTFLLAQNFYIFKQLVRIRILKHWNQFQWKWKLLLANTTIVPPHHISLLPGVCTFPPQRMRKSTLTTCGRICIGQEADRYIETPANRRLGLAESAKPVRRNLILHKYALNRGVAAGCIYDMSLHINHQTNENWLLLLYYII